MLWVIDGAGALTSLGVALYGVHDPNHPLWFPALASILCFWVAVRTVVRYGCGGYFWPAPALIYLGLTFIMHHLGFFALYYNFQGLNPNPQAALNAIWSMNLSYLALALGTYLYQRAVSQKPAAMIDRHYAAPLKAPPERDGLLVPMLVVFALALALSWYQVRGTLPIFQLAKLVLSGQYDQALMLGTLSRLQLNTEASYAAQGYIGQMYTAVIPMLSYIWFAFALITRKRRYIILAVLSVLTSMTLLLAGMARAPVLIYLIQLALVNILIFRPRLSMKWVYGIGGTAAAYVLLSILLGRGRIGEGFLQNLWFKFAYAVERVYLTNSHSSVKVFDLFPEQLPFRLGHTWINDLTNLLPGPGHSFTGEIYDYISVFKFGTASPHFVAEMWANGGWAWVIVVSLLAGIVYQWLNLRLLAVKARTPLKLALVGLLLFISAYPAVAGGLIAPINQGLISIALLYWILSGLARISLRLNGVFTSSQKSSMPQATPAPKPSRL